MQQLDIPEWKWNSISIDFVIGLPNTLKGGDSIWVIVDRLTKLSHFILIKIRFLLQRLDEIYISTFMKMHGILTSIVSDRDLRFNSRFWESLQEALGY